jgi:hypothetical protein
MVPFQDGIVVAIIASGLALPGVSHYKSQEQRGRLDLDGVEACEFVISSADNGSLKTRSAPV